MSDDDPDVLIDGEPVDGEADPDGNRACFVVAPIGSPNSDVRNQTNGLLDEAIRPIVEEKLGLEVIAPHEIAEAGSITRQVIQRLLEAELVIADLTGLNANVMYELAVRHAKGRPVVPIAEKNTSLPFDITTERTIFYEESFHGLNDLKPKLEDAARAAIEDEEPDNPIYRAQQDFQMREAVAGDDKMEYVMDRLDDINSAISNSASPFGGGASSAEPFDLPLPVEYPSPFGPTLTAKLVKSLETERDIQYASFGQGEEDILLKVVPAPDVKSDVTPVIQSHIEQIKQMRIRG